MEKQGKSDFILSFFMQEQEKNTHFLFAITKNFVPLQSQTEEKLLLHKHITDCLEYGVMVTLQILVLSF